MPTRDIYSGADTRHLLDKVISWDLLMEQGCWKGHVYFAWELWGQDIQRLGPQSRCAWVLKMRYCKYTQTNVWPRISLDLLTLELSSTIFTWNVDSHHQPFGVGSLAWTQGFPTCHWSLLTAAPPALPQILWLHILFSILWNPLTLA